jgi:hypothetical protein
VLEYLTQHHMHDEARTSDYFQGLAKRVPMTFNLAGIE